MLRATSAPHLETTPAPAITKTATNNYDVTNDDRDTSDNIDLPTPNARADIRRAISPKVTGELRFLLCNVRATNNNPAMALRIQTTKINRLESTNLGSALPMRTKEVAHIEERMESSWPTITSRKVPILHTGIERLLNKVAGVVGQEAL